MKPRKRRVDITQLPGGFSTKPSKYGSPKFQKLENWWSSPDDYGAIEVVPGFASIGGAGLGATNIPTIAYGEKSNLTRRYFVSAGTSVATITNTGVTANIKTGLTSNLRFTVFTYNDNVYFFNGTDTPFKYDFTSVSDVGYTQPSTATIATTASTASTNIVGVVKYWYSEVVSGEEGPLSESFGEIDRATGGSVSITSLPTTNPIRLYRSTRDGEVPLFVTALTTSSYVDSTHDKDLGGLPPIHGESPPSGINFPILHFNRAWGAVGSKLHWSDFADPDSWFSENYLNINENDGDQITALARERNGIVVFKKNHVYRVIGRDPNAEIFQITEVVPAEQNTGSIGTPSSYSIASTPVGHIFYYNKGYYLLGNEGLQYISEAIEDELREDILDDSGSGVISVYYPEYRMFITSVATSTTLENDRTYCYLIDRQEWFRLSVGFTSLALVEVGTNGQPATGKELWGNLSTGTGLVYHLFDPDQTDFAGTAITSEAVLPPIYLGSPGSFSSFLWATIMFEAKASGSFIVNYKFDGEATGTDVTVSQVKSGLARWFERINLGQQATQVELSFKTTANQPRAKIFGLALEGQELGTYNV